MNAIVDKIIAGHDLRFNLEFQSDEESGWIVVHVVELPGCVSQGKDEEEAINNIREAITAWMWAEDQKAIKSLPENQTPLLVAV